MVHRLFKDAEYLCSMVLSHTLPRMTVRNYDGITVNVLHVDLASVCAGIQLSCVSG